MKTFIKAVLLTMFLFNCGVNKSTQTTAPNSDQLLGVWVHSHEEDYDDIKVYRPSSYQFKPSRGREKMNILDNGILEYTPIAPNDLPKTFNGTWMVSKSNLVLEYENNKKSYQLIESTSTILKLKR